MDEMFTAAQGDLTELIARCRQAARLARRATERAEHTRERSADACSAAFETMLVREHQAALRRDAVVPGPFSLGWRLLGRG